jgi:NAD(P)-dependent dehydrogenase (short-subunit alcohol dehydrogenase family)
VDLRMPTAAAWCEDATLSISGTIDLLINCAGATRRGHFFELTDADWHDGFELKFHGTVRMCRACWPHIEKRKGAITNVVGIASRTPSADFTIGGSVNSALLNFTKALADIGRKVEVRVNAVNPGYVSTDRLNKRIQALASENRISEADATRLLAEKLGVNRFARAEEVAALVGFLNSDQGTYIHGATIDIDGGVTPGI